MTTNSISTDILDMEGKAVVSYYKGSSLLRVPLDIIEESSIYIWVESPFGGIWQFDKLTSRLVHNNTDSFLLSAKPQFMAKATDAVSAALLLRYEATLLYNDIANLGKKFSACTGLPKNIESLKNLYKVMQEVYNENFK